ncbi:MAG TPA: M15 family metallopeptidase [Mycobacteriales bacterium]|jgi:hypothetical protein|nr:M15 family metallopeptidase [Mycobacteriales bacterium]
MPRPLPALLGPLVALAVLGTSSAASAATATPPASPPPAPAPALPPLPVPPPLPDPVAVARAQAEVDRLAAEATRATVELTAGTEKWEQGQARLAQTQAAAFTAGMAAQAALERAEQARALLARVVNAAYRAPRPDSFTLALTSPPGQLEQAVLADAALDQVQGNQEQSLRAATEEGARAAELAAQADALKAQAEAEARDLEAQVAVLQARATAIRTGLDEATARLAAARLLPAPVPGTGGALCTGLPTTGFPNGFLPVEALCPLTVGGGHRLRADAAAAFNRLHATHPLCVTDSYRSYGEQVDVYARKPGLAAVPGSSNHGLGVAVDFCGGVETFGTPEYLWMQAHAPAYGWVHPAWAEPGGSRPEPWHWEYVGTPAPSR